MVFAQNSTILFGPVVEKDGNLLCERCHSGELAMYVVISDVLHIRVCTRCAEEARKLGLTVKPLTQKYENLN